MTPARVLALLGTALVAASGLIEIADAQPRAQMWMGASAGVAFLLAVPLARGDEPGVLAARARLLVGAGVAAVLAVIGLWQATERDEPRVLLLLVPAVLLFVTATLAVREAGRTGRALRADRLRARIDGQEAERRRWAQELHDQTLQDLAAIEVRLGALDRNRDPQSLNAGLAETRTMVREQIRSLRHLITQMRPLALDSLGLAAALQDLAQRAETGSGVVVRCEVDQVPARISPDAEVSCYRIVQEAVTNALRHAACHEIAVTAGTVGERLVITVRDDGIGLADEPERAEQRTGAAPSLGMVGMAERAESMGAALTCSAAPGGGTLVMLAVPLERLTHPQA